MTGKYKVITLCGSVKFRKDFIREQKRLTLEGDIVISVGFFALPGGEEISEEMVKMLSAYKGSPSKP